MILSIKREAVFLVELPFAWRGRRVMDFGEFRRYRRWKAPSYFHGWSWAIGCNSILQCPYWPLPPVLLDVAAFGECLLANRFRGRQTCGRADVWLARLYSRSMRFDDDFQGEVHPYRRSGVFGRYSGFGWKTRKVGSFLREGRCRGDAQFVLVRLGFRLDGDGNHGSRKVDRLKNDLLVFRRTALSAGG